MKGSWSDSTSGEWAVWNIFWRKNSSNKSNRIISCQSLAIVWIKINKYIERATADSLNLFRAAFKILFSIGSKNNSKTLETFKLKPGIFYLKCTVTSKNSWQKKILMKKKKIVIFQCYHFQNNWLLSSFEQRNYIALLISCL